MSNTIMEQEARQSPDIISKQIDLNNAVVKQIGEKLRTLKPKMVMVIGRGSSDHAGVFAKYLIEIEAQLPTFAAAPSVASVYNKQLQLESALVIVISQSGRSPDILAQAKMAKNAGAYCIALVNDETSPLTDIVDDVVPLRAGKEISVAATKSYLATLSALLHLVASWTNNQALLTSLKQLPELLQSIIESPCQLSPQSVEKTNNLVVLGRGLGYAIAKEMALKLKEVCSIHAEAFSSAEFLHGPITLVEKGLLVLDCLVLDESGDSHIAQVKEVTKRGAEVVHLHQNNLQAHPRLAPLLVLQRFYIDVANISTYLGYNPDVPKGLNKVTETL